MHYKWTEDVVKLPFHTRIYSVFSGHYTGRRLLDVSETHLPYNPGKFRFSMPLTLAALVAVLGLSRSGCHVFR